jgi:hypothetical protein
MWGHRATTQGGEPLHLIYCLRASNDSASGGASLLKRSIGRSAPSGEAGAQETPRLLPGDPNSDARWEPGPAAPTSDAETASEADTGTLGKKGKLRAVGGGKRR